MLELIRCTGKDSRNTPWSGECILKFVNITSGRIRFDCTASKDDVADGVDAWIGSPSIDELTMIGALLSDEQFSNLAARSEAGG